MIKWINVTCDATQHIVPAQKWLFEKYAPRVEVQYLNVGVESINTWGDNVAKRLPETDVVILGLDDYLPIDTLDMDKLFAAIQIVRDTDIERFELSWSAPRNIDLSVEFFFDDKGVGSTYLRYGAESLYSVSCQFSVWNMKSLKRTLRACTTPWDFEKRHSVRAACFERPPFRWIEESALSGRHPGKINVLGLRPDDVDELVNIGFIDRSRIQYGMSKGPIPEFDIHNVGAKYQEFYK